MLWTTKSVQVNQTEDEISQGTNWSSELRRVEEIEIDV